MINFGMTVLGQSYETIINRTPQWIYKQYELERKKHHDEANKNDKEISRKELLTNAARMRGFDREKELAKCQ